MSDSSTHLAGATLSLTVAPNGVGHAVRAVRVLRALVERHGPFAGISVAMPAMQLGALSAATRDWLTATRVRILHDIVEPGVGLLKEPQGFVDGRLLAWEQRWAAQRSLADADLIVSDNLAGVLAYRDDAVLLGSFLWSDVLEPLVGQPGVAAFVAHERALLAASRPTMLATADVAHPGVIGRTDAVLLPWFDDRPEPPDEQVAGALSRPAVAVVGGMSGAADGLLARARSALVAAGREVIDVSGTGDRAAWDRVGTVLCRPGLGTVTANVVSSRPMLLMSEPGNPELEATAAALVRLGLARVLEAPEQAVALMSELDDPEVRSTMVSALAARPTGGHWRAADLLAARLASGGSRSRTP